MGRVWEFAGLFTVERIDQVLLQVGLVARRAFECEDDLAPSRVGQHVAIGIATEAVSPPGSRTHRADHDGHQHHRVEDRVAGHVPAEHSQRVLSPCSQTG